MSATTLEACGQRAAKLGDQTSAPKSLEPSILTVGSRGESPEPLSGQRPGAGNLQVAGPGDDHPSSPEAVVHNFPPDFPLDDDYFEVALAEWNYRERELKALPKLPADEMPMSELMKVLDRAQKLKAGAE